MIQVTLHMKSGNLIDHYYEDEDRESVEELAQITMDPHARMIVMSDEESDQVQYIPPANIDWIEVEFGV